MTQLPMYPVFLQLLDDDIVSLTALTVLVDPECRSECSNVCITQRTLSLYLMTQCQLKLRHSATSLAQTLERIEVALRCPNAFALSELTLELARRKLLSRMKLQVAE